MTTFEKLVLRALSMILLCVVQGGPSKGTLKQAEEWMEDAKQAALETQ